MSGESATSTSKPTAPDDVCALADATEQPRTTLGFVIVSCPAEVRALGAWLPAKEGEWIFGRGQTRRSDAHPRLPLQQQRPGENVPLGALECAALSRTQLVVGNAGHGELALQRVGRNEVRVNGRKQDGCRVRAGDFLEIGAQLALLCVERPLRMRRVDLPLQPFASADRHGIVGESPAAWALRARIAFLSEQAEHVLVLGESGTGKEVVARALHESSGRPGAFVARNVTTIPESLCDAELFGNAENYPNPGMRERKGLVGAADRGTLFLDEFAELSPAIQPHFLRVFDGGEYQRLGEAATRRSDLRVVAATNRPLSALREDLAARFALTLQIPSLKERLEDVPLIVRHLLKEMTSENPALRSRFFTPEGEPRVSFALMRQVVQTLPVGNVRGLRSVLWASLECSEGSELQPTKSLELAPEAISVDDADEGGEVLNAGRLAAALDASGGSLEKTRRQLGLSSRFVLMRLMKKHGVRVQRNAGRVDK